jgi:hypothetical protein
VARNGKHRPPRPRIEIREGGASPAEAAAIAAAIEQFLRDTAPAPSRPSGTAVSAWARTAWLEDVRRNPGGSSPWGEDESWVL